MKINSLEQFNEYVWNLESKSGVVEVKPSEADESFGKRITVEFSRELFYDLMAIQSLDGVAELWNVIQVEANAEYHKLMRKQKEQK